MLAGLYPNVYTIVASAYPILLPSISILDSHPVRIGLFTEQDSGARGQPCGDGRRARRALARATCRSSSIRRPRLSTALLSCPRARRAARPRDRIDVIHLATTGPLAIVALLVASTLRPARRSDRSSCRSGRERSVAARYLRALVRQTVRLLVTSMAARASV